MTETPFRPDAAGILARLSAMVDELNALGLHVTIDVTIRVDGASVAFTVGQAEQ